jgi:ABC-type proline/glycine betaine transport system permease subunit
MAAISFFWTPYDVTRLVVADRMQPPSAEHWFGTDHFGRDVLSMIMVGARNSIAVALVAVGIGMGIGVPLGCWAAARGGWLDEALMRFNDLVFAFPALLSAIMITAVFGPARSTPSSPSASSTSRSSPASRAPARCRSGRANSSWRPAPPARARAASRRAYPAQHRQPAPGARHHPVRARHPGRGRPVLCRARRAAADAELGTHAVRRADAHDGVALAGAVPRPARS